MHKARYQRVADRRFTESHTIANKSSHIPGEPLHRLAKGYWRKASNQFEFIKNLEKQLGIIQWQDWYRVTRKEVVAHGGRGLYSYYENLADALQTFYPQHNWDMPSFGADQPVAPRGYWQKDANLIRGLEKAELKLGIKEVEDWYSVNLTDLKDVGFPVTVSRNKLIALLTKKYPNHTWDHAALLRGKFGQQKRLEKAVGLIFPNEDIQVNVRKVANLLNPKTGDYLELDIFLPSLRLAFEYQDIHHYKSTEYIYVPLEMWQERDATKLSLAKANNITLIIVPCWWDGSVNSLLPTIQKWRPELVAHLDVTGDPIPEEMPQSYLELQRRHRYIEDIGEPTTACFLTNMNINCTNWWIFEKYDGVRGFWHPKKKVFFSRKASQLALPQFILDTMPSDLFLDGELWFGRDTFQEAMKISNKADMKDINWNNFKYMVYDVPDHRGTYQERFTILEEYFKKEGSHKYIEVAPYEICKDMNHLESKLQDIIDNGGEGVILRDPIAPHQAGRAASYLKHKKYRDGEAKILKQVGPKQWECILPNGVSFVASEGTTEFVKRWNPKAGDIASFKHRGYLKESRKPKSPALYRGRPDLTWDDIVANWKERKRSTNVPPIKRPSRAIPLKPKGYWLKPGNVREFLTHFAETQGFDPLRPENWSSITYAQIHATPGGGSMLAAHGSAKKALKFAFPDLRFLFKLKPSSKEPTPSRAFFDDYARNANFDPLITTNWYSLPLTNLASTKEGEKIGLHGGFPAALTAAYPELRFNWAEGSMPKGGKRRSEIARRPRGYWRDRELRRRFFIEFAESMEFDATKVENWNEVTQSQVAAKDGGKSLLALYKSLKRALIDTFPELDFKFKSPPAEWPAQQPRLTESL